MGRGGKGESGWKKSLRILVSQGDCVMGGQFPNMLERGQYALRS